MLQVNALMHFYYIFGFTYAKESRKITQPLRQTDSFGDAYPNTSFHGSV